MWSFQYNFVHNAQSYIFLNQVSDYIKDLQQRNAAQGCNSTVDAANREDSSGPGSKGKKVQGSKGG